MGLLTWVLALPVALAVAMAVITKDGFSNAPIPDTMWALITNEAGDLVAAQMPVPQPAYGQLLVRLHYAPVNPSDIYFALGDYGLPSGAPKTRPHKIGFEGAGIAVASGGGLLPALYTKLKLRLAVASGGQGATWAEFAIADPMLSLPLPPSVDLMGGSASFVNPLTTVAMLEMAREKGDVAIVHTAASSALGLQLLRAAPQYNVSIVCVVRGESNARMLLDDMNHPAHLVVRSDAPDFADKLRAAIKTSGATLAFDAVAGAMSRTVYDAMPSAARVHVYGMLSGEAPDDALLALSDDAKKPFQRFHVKTWLDAGGLPRMAKCMYSLYSMLPKELATEFAEVLPLRGEDTVAKLKAYAKHQKGGKMVLKLA